MSLFPFLTYVRRLFCFCAYYEPKSKIVFPINDSSVECVVFSCMGVQGFVLFFSYIFNKILLNVCCAQLFLLSFFSTLLRRKVKVQDGGSHSFYRCSLAIINDIPLSSIKIKNNSQFTVGSCSINDSSSRRPITIVRIVFCEPLSHRKMHRGTSN